MTSEMPLRHGRFGRRTNRPIAIAVRQALLGTALLAVSSAAVAEPQVAVDGARATRDTALEEVVVTAQRRTENLQTVPIAISALEGDGLRERNVLGLQDISSTVPSVNIQNRRSSGVVTIRGIGFEVATAGADPAVAVHNDGVYVARPAAALTNFFDVERVEIARGPQGTLYGRNATGGAINIISRKPTAEPEGYAEASYGNYNALLAEGALSGPLGGEALQGRVAFQYNERDGYGRNRFLGKDINDWDSLGARVQLRLAAGEQLSFLLAGDYYDQSDAAFTPTFGGYAAPCATTPPARRCGTAYGGTALQDPQDVTYDFASVNERTTKGAALTAEWTPGPVTLRSITGYRTTDYRWEVDGDETTFNMGFVGRKEDAKQLSQELQLLGESDRLTWLGGVFYFQEENDALGYADAPIPDFRTLVIRQFGQLETDAWAVFGQATWKITDRWALTAGGRYSDETKKLKNESSQQLPGVIPAPRPTREASWNKFTPKGTLEYTVSDDLFFYVSAQQGFKSGGFAAGALTPPFNPEEVWSYEGGVKAKWADGRVRTNVAVFHFNYKDLQVGFVQNVPGGAVVTVVTNAAEASNTGIELELAANLSDAFSVEANASFMDATFDKYNTVDPNRPTLGTLDLSGNSLAQAPDFTGFLAAQYDWSMATGGLSLRGEYAYTGKVYFDAYNREGIMSQDSYGLANAFLTYDSGRSWRVSLFARNLFDEDYRVGSAIAGAIWGSPVLSIPGPPRTYGVRASFTF